MSKHKQLNLWESVEEQTKKATGNTQLVDYGIQNETSDFRVHVGYLAQHIYVFPTQSGVKALNKYKNQLVMRNARQNGIVTANGYPIPISYIENLEEVLIPLEIYNKNRAYENESTGRKGKKATMLTLDMLKKGLISLPINATIIDDKDIQIAGTDIIVCSHLKIQVKCDYRAGNKKHHRRVTGNLFLQIAECNPERRY